MAGQGRTVARMRETRCLSVKLGNQDCLHACSDCPILRPLCVSEHDLCVTGLPLNHHPQVTTSVKAGAATSRR